MVYVPIITICDILLFLEWTYYTVGCCLEHPPALVYYAIRTRPKHNTVLHNRNSGNVITTSSRDGMAIHHCHFIQPQGCKINRIWLMMMVTQCFLQGRITNQLQQLGIRAPVRQVTWPCVMTEPHTQCLPMPTFFSEVTPGWAASCKRTLWITGPGFLQARWPSCYLTNSVKALKLQSQKITLIS